MSAQPAKPLVELRGLSKSYGGVDALSDVSFAITPASVHALVGENGAGKSTLVKILTGVVAPDTGDVLLDGQARRIGDPQTAHRLGSRVGLAPAKSPFRFAVAPRRGWHARCYVSLR